MEGAGGGIQQARKGALGRLPQMSLEFGKGHFDGVQIGAVGGKVEQGGIAGLNGLVDSGHFVRGKVVADDDVAAVKFRGEHLLEVGQEQGSLHGAVEQERSTQAVVPQSHDQSRSAPMAVRDAGMAALPADGTSVQAGHFGVQARFIQEDQTANVPAPLPAAPPPAGLFNVGPVLLVGAQRFFYSSTPAAPAGATEH